MRSCCWLFGLFLSTIAFAQPPCPLDLGPDLLLCPGGEVQLSAPAGFSSYVWNTGEGTPGITVHTAGTYWCTCTVGSAAAQDLIVNGAFTDGATGFTSDYELPTVEGPYGLLSDEAQYVVATDPSAGHIDFQSCGDHTTGTGPMLVVNGAATPNVNVWCQQVTVQPNTDYTFGAWLMTVFPANPAELGFSINGVSIGDPLLAPDAPCTWSPFQATWNSGAATTAQVCIENLNTAIFGNDFALDDITFTGGGVGGSCADTVAVLPFTTTVDLGPDTALCAGVAVTLTVEGVPGDLLWSNGATAAQITVTGPGSYWVRVSEQGCTATDTVHVDQLPTLPSASGPMETALCPGRSVVLGAAVPGAVNYLWSTGATTPTVEVAAAGPYTVLITGACGQRSDTIVVVPADCSATVHVPNVFTPNDDGINEIFLPIVHGPVYNYTFEIFNRWGQLIHTGTDPAEGWDGTYRGQRVPDGTYVWVVRYRAATPQGDRDHKLIGHLTLLR